MAKEAIVQCGAYRIPWHNLSRLFRQAPDDATGVSHARVISIREQ